MKKQLGLQLPGVLLHMLRSGAYIPDALWVVPRTCGGMDSVRAAAMWKCMVSPSTMMLEDVCQIFFNHTSPSSCLRDLGCQQLAADLTTSREDVEHIYDVHEGEDEEDNIAPQGNMKNSTNSQVHNDIVVDVPSSNVESGWDSIHSPRFVDELLRYIPIFVDNHDLENHLSLCE